MQLRRYGGRDSESEAAGVEGDREVLGVCRWPRSEARPSHEFEPKLWKRRLLRPGTSSSQVHGFFVANPLIVYITTHNPLLSFYNYPVSYELDLFV